MSTFDFAKESGVDSAAFFLAVPYPDTPLYDTCRRRSWLSEDTSKADFKHANIKIRKSDKEYVMSGDEYIALVDAKTKEFNDWSRRRDPESWNKKYELFLKNNPSDSTQIRGRVV